MRNNGTHLPPIFLHMVPSLKDKPPYFDLHLTDAQWLPEVDPGHWDSSLELYERGNYENRYHSEAIREESNSPGSLMKSPILTSKVVYPENEVILELSPRSELFHKPDPVDVILSKKVTETNEIWNMDGNRNKFDEIQSMKAKYLALEEHNATLLLRIECLNDIVANMVVSTTSIASVTSSVHDTIISNIDKSSIEISTIGDENDEQNDSCKSAVPILFGKNSQPSSLENVQPSSLENVLVKVANNVHPISCNEESMAIIKSTNGTPIEQRKEAEEGSENQKEGLEEGKEKISSTLTHAVFRRLKSIKSLLDNTAIKTLLEGSTEVLLEAVIESPSSSSLSVPPSSCAKQPSDAITEINDYDKDCDKDALEALEVTESILHIEYFFPFVFFFSLPFSLTHTLFRSLSLSLSLPLCLFLSPFSFLSIFLLTITYFFLFF